VLDSLELDQVVLLVLLLEVIAVGPWIASLCAEDLFELRARFGGGVEWRLLVLSNSANAAPPVVMLENKIIFKRSS